MLRRLHISNFALIDEMDVEFPGHLTVITGETGAGKSIFLEALALSLGKRAETSVLRNKSRKCIVEAEFQLDGLDLQDFFEEFELDPDKQIILRREISPEGKSRSFLNDSVVSLSALKALAERIIDIHSQHQTLMLNTQPFQVELLDAFAGNLDTAREYKNKYTSLLKCRKRLQDLQQKEAEARKQQDYLQFQFEELQEAKLENGMLLALEEESNALENAESIRALLLQAAQGLSGGDDNVLQYLARVRNSVNEAGKMSAQYKDLQERLNSAYVELKELAVDLEGRGEDLHSDPQRLEVVNARLDKLNHLLRKHNVKTEAELLLILSDIENQLQRFSSLEDELASASSEQQTLTAVCKKIAQKLSAARNKACGPLEKEVQLLLKGLSMENAVFKVEVTTQDELGPTGTDGVKFLFSANKGSAPADLSKVASGGELSRLMLTLKAIMAGKKKLPAIIFDEIDTGVSGDVANKIGNILFDMGHHMQVITITHLPQIASKGQHHLFVYKNDDEEATVSHIRTLNKEDRIVEIAKMLSTSNPTASALKNARELLSVN